MIQLTTLFQQTFWQVLGKIITSFATFIVLALVARNYGEEGTGVFTLALTYLAIFYLLSDFGFNAHVLRKIKKQKSNIKDEYSKLLGTRMIWSMVLVILAVGLLPFWPFATLEFSQTVLFGSLAIVASGIFVTCNLIFQERLRYDQSFLASSIGAFIGLGIFAYLVYGSLPPHLLILGHFFGWFAIAIVAIVLVKKLLPSVSPLYQLPYTINLFKQSWPIAGTLLLNVIYFRADSFLIAYFRSNMEVGIYNIAFAVFQTALVLPTFIMNAYYPMLLKSLKDLKLVGLGLLGLSAVGTIITLIFSPLIIKLLTGGGFVGSSISLQILSLGFPAYFLSALLMWLLVVKEKYKLMLLIYTIGLAVSLILNFIFIPQYSYIAASWITVICEYLILLLQAVILIRK